MGGHTRYPHKKSMNHYDFADVRGSENSCRRCPRKSESKEKERWPSREGASSSPDVRRGAPHHDGPLRAAPEPASTPVDAPDAAPCAAAACFSCCSILERPVSVGGMQSTHHVKRHRTRKKKEHGRRTVKLLRRPLAHRFLHRSPLVDRLLCVVEAHARRHHQASPAQHLQRRMTYSARFPRESLGFGGTCHGLWCVHPCAYRVHSMIQMQRPSSGLLNEGYGQVVKVLGARSHGIASERDVTCLMQLSLAHAKQFFSMTTTN